MMNIHSHVSVGLPIEETIRQVKPTMTLLSHVLELGHSAKPPNAWRWSFDLAIDTIKNLPEKQATILNWGKRRLAVSAALARCSLSMAYLCHRVPQPDLISTHRE